jgi:hypothetical protein
MEGTFREEVPSFSHCSASGTTTSTAGTWEHEERIQGTFGNIQGTFREHSGHIQATFRERLVKVEEGYCCCGSMSTVVVAL